MKELHTLVGYEQLGDLIVVRFYNKDEEILLTRQECEERLDMLQKQGLPHEQTALALEVWPK